MISKVNINTRANKRLTLKLITVDYCIAEQQAAKAHCSAMQHSEANALDRLILTFGS